MDGLEWFLKEHEAWVCYGDYLDNQIEDLTATIADLREQRKEASKKEEETYVR